MVTLLQEADCTENPPNSSSTAMSERSPNKLVTLFGRITFVPTLVFNVALEKMSVRQWYSRIDQNVILGALPWKSISQELVEKEKVRGVCSLNQNYELSLFGLSAVADATHWSSLGVKFLQLPTADIFHSPTLDNLNRGVAFMKQIIAEGAEGNNTVYVHCKAGRTRSATLVGCYLIDKHGFTPREAESYMKERRPHIFLQQKQRESLDQFYKEHIKSTSQS